MAITETEKSRIMFGVSPADDPREYGRRYRSSASFKRAQSERRQQVAVNMADGSTAYVHPEVAVKLLQMPVEQRIAIPLSRKQRAFKYAQEHRDYYREQSNVWNRANAEKQRTYLAAYRTSHKYVTMCNRKQYWCPNELAAQILQLPVDNRYLYLLRRELRSGADISPKKPAEAPEKAPVPAPEPPPEPTPVLTLNHPVLGVPVRSDGYVFVPENRTRPGHWTKGSPSSLGYLQVKISAKSYKVHRLVAQTFIPNPQNLPEVDHIDRDKSNNSVQNLRWCDHVTNCRNTEKYECVSNRNGAHYRQDPDKYHKEYYEANRERILKNRNNYKSVCRYVRFADGSMHALPHKIADEALKFPVRERIFPDLIHKLSENNSI